MKNVRKGKKVRGLSVRKAFTGYMFIMPFLLGFTLFLVVPLFTSLRMSLSEVGFSDKGFVLRYIGATNYRQAFLADPDFNRMLTEELAKIGTRVPFIIILSFFIALMLNQKFKLRGLARAVFFLPVILSSGVVVGIDTNNALLNSMKDIMAEYSQTGRITDVLEELLLGSLARYGPVKFVLDAVNGVYDVIMASGIQILIFLAGLQSIPASMFEAAKIEGATAWESFWKITLPMISSLIVVTVVYSIVDNCIKSDSELLDKVRETMIARMNYGFSSAMAWIYFASIMLIVVVVVGILSKVVFYDE